MQPISMKKTTFEITKMDCPSEENLIRTKLSSISGIKNLDFDIPNRKLTVFHQEETELIEESIHALHLGGKIILTEQTDQTEFEEHTNQKKLLLTVLAINFSFFIVEIITGFIAQSMGLIADSLDMLADSFVYGISLLAVGATFTRKKQIARIAGYFQLILATIGFAKVIQRFTEHEIEPNFIVMVYISIFALFANAYCLYLLQKSKRKTEVHMKASLIFTSNDVIINAGVIFSGLLVNWFHSNKPDLIIGSIVFFLVIRGAFRILKLGK